MQQVGDTALVPPLFITPEVADLRLEDRLSRTLVLGNRRHRFADFAALVSRFVTPEDFHRAAQAIKDGDRRGLQFEEEWDFLLQEWGRRLGEAGVRDIASTFGGKDPGHCYKQALYGWAQSDPDAAVKWINEYPNLPEAEAVTVAVLRGIALKSVETGTAAALASLREGAGFQRDVVCKTLVEQAVCRDGVDGLTSWFEALPQNAEDLWAKEAAFPHAYRALEHSDLDKAIEFLNAHALEPWRGDRAYHDLAGQIATKRGPESALNWLASLPALPDNRASWPGAGTIARSWQASDPEAFMRWLSAQPADAALATHLRTEPE